MDDVASQKNPGESKNRLSAKYLLWMDGAGVFLLCLGDEVTVGGLRNDPDHADVCLMANLARKHLTLIRSNGSYHLKPHGPVSFKDSPFPTLGEEHISLESPAEWRMGDGVEIRFRQPTVLSLTAVLDFQSSHRPLAGQPPSAADQVILMDQNCLVGPGPGQHIGLRDAADGLILYRSKNQLWLKSKALFSKNDRDFGNSSVLQSGDTVTGQDFRFRIEAVE
jgi:hypothetical protein